MVNLIHIVKDLWKKASKQTKMAFICGLCIIIGLYFPFGFLGSSGSMIQGGLILGGIFGLLKVFGLLGGSKTSSKKNNNKKRRSRKLEPYCSKCGEKFRKGEVHCPSCGRKRRKL